MKEVKKKSEKIHFVLSCEKKKKKSFFSCVRGVCAVLFHIEFRLGERIANVNQWNQSPHSMNFDHIRSSKKKKKKKKNGNFFFFFFFSFRAQRNERIGNTKFSTRFNSNRRQTTATNPRQCKKRCVALPLNK
jgi:hypothetical protein